MANRKCIQCGEQIRECMGFVSFKDFLRAMAEEIPFSEVGETCGKCLYKKGNIKNPNKI